jgi:hypothetical protein
MIGVLRVLAIATSGLAVLALSGCGSDISTAWHQGPAINAGGNNWGEPGPNPSGSPVPTIHNTNFCEVSPQNQIQSKDQLSVGMEGSDVHAQAGGCVSRPIREVWAVLLNNGVMKPDNVDEYTSTPRPDLVPTSPDPGTVFAFDINNVHHAIGGLYNPSWIVRWYHTVTFGTYAEPDEVAIFYQKVEGTSHIRELRGEYLLDRTTDGITSYANEQWVDADSYGTDNGTSDMGESFGKVRNGAPDWGQLPTNP